MQGQRAGSLSSKQSRQRAPVVSSTRRLPSRWQQKRAIHADERKVMADKATSSPKKHGSRVHRYGPRRRAQNTHDNKHQACCATTNTVPSCAERLVIGGEDTNPLSAVQKTSAEYSNPRSPPPSSPRAPPTDNEEVGPPSQRQDGDGSSHSDKDEDPETEELARLRCTSERTEVIAEREIRRRSRQRRCADYPGLAFGSSIFSSDTLMKFSVIKNELHNILNSQLKRVSMLSSLIRYVIVFST